MRRLIGRLMAGALAFAPAAADAATQCFTKSEQDAAMVRQLKSEMMVIALTCRNYQQLDTIGYYDRFVTKHRAPLQNSAKVLQAHFKRYYGADAALTRLEKYDTVLANDSSNRNMDINRDAFCARSVSLLSDAVATDTAQLAAFSATRVAPAFDMPLCGQPGRANVPPQRTAAVIVPPPSQPVPATPSPAPAMRSQAAYPAPPPPPPSLIGARPSAPAQDAVVLAAPQSAAQSAATRAATEEAIRRAVAKAAAVPPATKSSVSGSKRPAKAPAR